LFYAFVVNIDPTLLLSTEGSVLGFGLKVFVADRAVMIMPLSVGLECFAEVF
jgi:hypothetical protein